MTLFGVYSNSKTSPLVSPGEFDTLTSVMPGIIACGDAHAINVDDIKLDDILEENPNVHPADAVNPEPAMSTIVLPEIAPDLGTKLATKALDTY